MMQKNRVNIAVAGLGRMINTLREPGHGAANSPQGKRHVSTLLNRAPRANVVAVCSNIEHELSWARKEYKDTDIAVYSSYEQMLAHPQLEAVWISTSTDVHARQTLDGIERGLHVL